MSGACTSVSVTTPLARPPTIQGNAGSFAINRVEQCDGVQSDRRCARPDPACDQVRSLVENAPLPVDDDHRVGRVLGQRRVVPACCAPTQLSWRLRAFTSRVDRTNATRTKSSARDEQRHWIRVDAVANSHISMTPGINNGTNVSSRRASVTRTATNARSPGGSTVVEGQVDAGEAGRPKHPDDVRPLGVDSWIGDPQRRQPAITHRPTPQLRNTPLWPCALDG